jgi:diguanylate cyclase (GGDEF)-like protein/PAS domain S-box-containing protein
MNKTTQISFTIIVFLLINFLITASSWLYIDHIKNSISEDGRIINYVGQLRGGIQKFSKLYFLDQDTKKSDSQYIDEKFNSTILLLGNSFPETLDHFLKINNEWINYKDLLKKCLNERNMSCNNTLYNHSEKIWEEIDSFNTILTLKSTKKLNNLNFVIYILIITLILLTAVIVIVYKLINRTLGHNHEQMEKYIDMLDKNVITSKTDLKGKITYTSKAFCKISGYLPEELLGKNHNIVRHPDMPSSVYKELWNTIKMGETWSGEIKNRTKDGSYYWVQSDISPYYEYGKHVGYIAVRQDITNKKLVEEISVRDHLTKLYNRVKLDEEFAKEILRSQRFGHPLSIIVIDIDHFKSVNDTYGHLVGDSVLVNMAKLLEKNIRTIDILGRWGGEEFIIICPETESKDAYKLAEKIRQNVEKYEFTTVGNKTASFGVSQYVTGENEQQLVDRADKALYKAKEEGRNKVIVS